MTVPSVRATVGVLLAIAMVALAARQEVSAQAASQPAEEPAPVFDKAYLADAANIRVGQTVWGNQCRHCHGASAYPGKAPKLNPGQLTPDKIYDRVTYGFGKMPAWKDVFSLDERKAVVAYIKSDQFNP